MIDPFGLTKTEVAIFEMGETSGWSMGARAEQERIIKLLEQTESPSHLWGGIAWSIALIKGEK